MRISAGKLNLHQQVMLQWGRVWPYNAFHCLKLAGKPDPERFKQAAREALTSAGITQVAVDPKSGRYEYLEGPASIHLKVVSCTSHSEVALAGQIQKELNRPFPAAPHTPVRFFLLDAAAGFHYLGITYNHWTADGWAIRLLLYQILALYYGLSLPRGPAPVSLYPPGYWSLFGHLCPGKALGRWPLEFLRELVQPRYAYRQRYKDKRDFRTGFATYGFDEVNIQDLKEYARAKGGTVHDLFLAALAETISFYTPQRLKHPRRRGLRIGSVVDLRSLSRKDLSRTHGLFVGYFIVFFGKPEDDFSALLQSVVQETAGIKQRKGYLNSTMGLRLSPSFWPWLSDTRKAEFFRKGCLAAGISNVNLAGSQLEAEIGDRVLEYLRGVSTGPHLPIIILFTTFKGKVSIGVSYRLAGFDEAQIERIMRRFIWRLQTLVG